MTDTPDGDPVPVLPAVSPEDADAAATAALRRAARSTGPTRRKRTKTTQVTYSDSRDPATIGDAVDALIADQGWQDATAVARLMGDWPQIVGADLAEHVHPTSFEAGELTLLASSTTWATQVRLLLPDLQRAVDQAVGKGVVRHIVVQGPQGPTWRSGPRRVKGRGPRDTYG